MSEIIPISIAQGQDLLEDLRSQDKRPNVKAHRNQKGELCGWDFGVTDGSVVRAPALLFPWVPHERATWPFRYMTTKVPVTLHKWNGQHPVDKNTTDTVLPVGTRVKIVMVSRMGDVGITDDLRAEHGYHLRVNIDKLEELFGDFSCKPYG